MPKTKPSKPKAKLKKYFVRLRREVEYFAEVEKHVASTKPKTWR